MEDGNGVTRYHDAICALRLAVWTLERSASKEGVDPLHIVEMIARRAEALRETIVAERSLV